MLIKKSYLYFPLTFAFFGLFLAIDQLLLPMFHFSGLPFKISYFLCGLWFIDFLMKTDRSEYLDKEFKDFCYPIFIIMACSILGELLFNAWWTADSQEPLFRSLIIYILMLFSFGLGLSSKNFNINWLTVILLVSIFLNLLFIVFKFQLPSWLINFYYSSEYVNAFSQGSLGLSDAQSILELSRPRGLFPNPNGSAFLVNIISLFIFIGVNKKVCNIPSPVTYILIILMPIILSTLLASRGEFIVSLLLGFLHMKKIFKVNRNYSLKFISFLLLIPLFLGSYLATKVDMEEFQHNIDRAFSVFQIINNIDDGVDQDTRDLGSIARPLLTLKDAYERFRISPIFGSGYAKDSSHYSYEVGTDHFHNDWFRLLATSGIIGFLAMLWIINRFVLVLGWPALIPFVLPGMINSFLLNIPAVMFYFFMIAVIRVKIKRNES